MKVEIDIPKTESVFDTTERVRSYLATRDKRFKYTMWTSEGLNNLFRMFRGLVNKDVGRVYKEEIVCGIGRKVVNIRHNYNSPFTSISSRVFSDEELRAMVRA